jgi:hypothetical protein
MLNLLTQIDKKCLEITPPSLKLSTFGRSFILHLPSGDVLFMLQVIVRLVAADVNPDQDLYRQATRMILGLVPRYQWTFFTDNPTMRSWV